MNFFGSVWVILWMVLALCVVLLAFYRRMLASHEDDIVHVISGESRVLTQQATFAQKLEKIDFWGKTLTIVLAAYGLILGSWILYELWQQSARIAN